MLLLYGVLTIIMSAWTSLSVPPAPIRLAFLLVVFLPLVFYVPNWTPIVITLFVIIALNGFASSFMPVNKWFYIIVLIAIISLRYNDRHLPVQPLFLILLIYTFLVNSFTEGASEVMYQPLCCMFLFAFLVPVGDSLYPHLFSYAFIISALAISVLFYFYGSTFSMDFGDYERSYWKDPNYFGCQIGMGVVAGIIELFFDKKRKWYVTVILVATFFFSFLTLMRIASRGAVLAISLAFISLIIFSKMKIVYKGLIIASVALLICFFYSRGVMDLMVYRLTEESSITTAGDRTLIWGKKLSAFLSSGVLNTLFGYGNLGGQKLGFSTLQGFHNDFLAFLVEYGIIGLFFFVWLLFAPLKKENNKVIVLSLVVYLITCCISLEPITHGVFAFFAFLFYAIVWSHSPDIQHQL